ncbi:MAG: HEAT repeat domain-containing protein [Armatimonadota bacterium]
MKKLVLILAVVVILSICILSYASDVKSGKFGYKSRLTDLTDIRPILQNKKITTFDKTNILLLWFDEELRHPSPTSKGLGGGDINSGYIHAQIIKALAETGDPVLLRKISAGTNKARSNAASLSLGLMGDKTQIDSLISILKKNKEPFFRVSAAEALGSLGASSAIDALNNSLKDGYSVIGATNSRIGTSVIYPVREAAKIALNVIKSESRDIRAARNHKMKQFEKRLQASREK